MEVSIRQPCRYIILVPVVSFYICLVVIGIISIAKIINNSYLLSFVKSEHKLNLYEIYGFYSKS